MPSVAMNPPHTGDSNVTFVGELWPPKPLIEVRRRHVPYWHITDMAACPINVCFTIAPATKDRGPSASDYQAGNSYRTFRHARINVRFWG
jgi:hypothetical protein